MTPTDDETRAEQFKPGSLDQDPAWLRSPGLVGGGLFLAATSVHGLATWALLAHPLDAPGVLWTLTSWMGTAGAVLAGAYLAVSLTVSGSAGRELVDVSMDGLGVALAILAALGGGLVATLGPGLVTWQLTETSLAPIPPVAGFASFGLVWVGLGLDGTPRKVTATLAEIAAGLGFLDLFANQGWTPAVLGLLLVAVAFFFTWGGPAAELGR